MPEPYKRLYDHLGPVPISHLTCFLTWRLRLKTSKHFSMLSIRLSLQNRNRTQVCGTLSHKTQGCHFPATASRGVRSFQGNAWTCTNWNQKNSFLASLLIYSPPLGRDTELNLPCREENFPPKGATFSVRFIVSLWTALLQTCSATDICRAELTTLWLVCEY